MKEVKIGNQVWLAENLTVDKFRNGDPIQHVRSIEEWKKANKQVKPASCYYNFDPINGQKYGKLYNWDAVIDPRGLAPDGWHIPSYDEWIELIHFLGGEEIAGNKMKSFGDYKDRYSNESGFSALLGGYQFFNGKLDSIGESGYWWSSTEAYPTTAWVAVVFIDGGTMMLDDDKRNGCYVRCIKGKESNSERKLPRPSSVSLLSAIFFGGGN